MYEDPFKTVTALWKCLLFLLIIMVINWQVVTAPVSKWRRQTLNLSALPKLQCLCIPFSKVVFFKGFPYCIVHFNLTIIPRGEQVSPPCFRVGNWDSESLYDLVTTDLWQNWF